MSAAKQSGDKIRILHIAESFGIGGAERVLAGIINCLGEFEHHLMILGGEETLLSEVDKSVKFTSLRSGGLIGPLLKWRKVRRYIRENRIEIVHSHLFVPCLLARLATPSTVPLFNSLHSIPSIDIYKSGKWALWLDRLTYRKRHFIIAVAETVLTDFDRHVNRKGRGLVLYNYMEEGFRSRAVAGAMRGPGMRLISVGNLRPPKNYAYIMKAFRDMPQGISLDIYGEGALRGELQAEIDKYALPVRLCGSIQNIGELLPQYDAFLMASHYEGCSVALLEAMACGLPAILSDIPSFRETTAGNARFFTLDSPGNLVSAITEVKESPATITGYTEAARNRAKEMGDKTKYMETLRKLYLSCL